MSLINNSSSTGNIAFGCKFLNIFNKPKTLKPLKDSQIPPEIKQVLKTMEDRRSKPPIDVIEFTRVNK